MFKKQPTSYDISFMDLPLSRLHVLETGQGEPLIMVPATISELENWRTLAQFMGQWFHVYFFELPGHGESSPFREEFSSHQVAKLVEQMADHLGLERFNLMGFSFEEPLAFCSDYVDCLKLADCAADNPGTVNSDISSH